MKTFSAKASDIQRKWYVIDATDKVVGAIAVKTANLLRGKEKPTFTPHADTGDHVIIINAEKSVFTGKKETQKTYMRYSGYIGGHKHETAKKLRSRKPELILQNAVKGMVSHNRLGRTMLKKLFVYAGSEHPHAAQNPQPATV